MSRGRRESIRKNVGIVGLLVGVAAILVLSATLASAKGKPPKPPEEPEMTNPALLYREIWGKSGLYLMTADGSQTVQVVKEAKRGVTRNGRYSPDGTMIAYNWRVGGRQATSLEFYVANPDGSEPVLVDSNGPLSTTNGGWTWSPDGTKIVYSSAGRIWALDLLDGSEELILDQVLYDMESPRFSPDLDPVTDGYQGYLAFQGYDQEELLTIGYDIVLLEVFIDESGTIGTGALIPLCLEGNQGGGFEDSGPKVWSPDGQFVAYNNGSLASGAIIGLAVEQIDGQLLVTVSGHWPLGVTVDTWSPDGEYVAFSEWGPWQESGPDIELYRAVFVVDPDGTPWITDVVNVTNTPRQREVGPRWNPNWVNDL